MSTILITELNCESCGETGPRALESEDARSLAIREDWLINDDGDFCPSCAIDQPSGLWASWVNGNLTDVARKCSKSAGLAAAVAVAIIQKGTTEPVSEDVQRFIKLLNHPDQA